ncbi:MAG: leucine-rich repeat domain-containing protein, partial [Gammaproteobacteria bacterium]|nr:leucine-rich repeat domain-containing protein [Gammaproteobacteria bacterium]
MGTFINNILVDNQIFPPEVVEELERLLGNTLQKTIQVTATKINPYTFYGESSLVAINASDATTVGQYAFNNCTNLKLANLQAVTSIDAYAFQNNSNLTTVGLDAMVSIGDYA